MKMLSQFFIMSAHGDTLAFRDYRGDVVRGTPEIFYRKVKSYVPGSPMPIFHVEGTHFLHISRSGLYFVFTSKANVPPVYALELLNRIAGLCKDYCGCLNEEAVRSNFALIYEVLDEALDLGFPQSMSTEDLKDYIFNEARAVSPALGPVLIGGAAVFGTERRTVPSVASNKSVISSKKDLSSRGKKEIFIDILEKLNVLIASNGNVICAEVDGQIVIKSFLVGNPLVRLNLNENLQIGPCTNEHFDVSSPCLTYVNYHECVNEDAFLSSRCLVFKPPEGECTIMSYRITNNLALPFMLHPFIEDGSGKEILVSIKLDCCVPGNYYATNIVVKLPVPKETISVSYDASSSAQSFEYRSSAKVIQWSIRKVVGGTHLLTRFRITLSSKTIVTRKEIGPISMEFEFPLFVCSGLQIKGLRVEEESFFEEMEMFELPKRMHYVRSLSDLTVEGLLQNSFLLRNDVMQSLPVKLAYKLVRACFSSKSVDIGCRKKAFAAIFSQWPRSLFSLQQMSIEDFDGGDVRLISHLIKEGAIGKIEILDISRSFDYHADFFHHQLNYGARDLLELAGKALGLHKTPLRLIADLAITIETFDISTGEQGHESCCLEISSSPLVLLSPKTIKYSSRLENLSTFLLPFVNCLKGLVIAVHNRVELLGTRLTDADLQCLASLSELEYLHLEDYNMFPLETVLRNIRSVHVNRLDLFTSRLIKDALRAVVNNPVFDHLSRISVAYNEGWKLEETRSLFSQVMLINKRTLTYVSIVGMPLNYVEDMVELFMQLEHLEVLAIAPTKSALPMNIALLYKNHPSLKRLWLKESLFDDVEMSPFDLRAS